MDPFQSLGLKLNLETKGNMKGDATKTTNPVQMSSQQFRFQTMNQRHYLNSRPSLSAPPTWVGSLPNYNFVNSSIQRKCTFPPRLPFQQGNFPSNQFSYFTPFVLPQSAFNPKLTTGIRLKNDRKNKSPSKTFPEQHNVGSTTANHASWSNETAPNANRFRPLPNIVTQVENTNKDEHISKKMHKTHVNKEYCGSDVTWRSVPLNDSNVNSLFQHTSETRRYQPYVKNAGQHKKHNLTSGGSAQHHILHNIHSRKTAESPSNMESLNRNDNETERKSTKIENPESTICKTNVLSLERRDEAEENVRGNLINQNADEQEGNVRENINNQNADEQEGNVRENINNQNADELLLSITNRRIKINRLLEEQKRLMANIHVMKTELPINNVNGPEI